MPEAELVSSAINRGDELDDDQLSKLKALSSQSKVYDQAIHYLSFRPRSAKETKDHLLKKGHPVEEIELVTERLLSQGLLSDEGFAKSWVESRRLLKPASRRKLLSELRQKGVDEVAIESALSEVDEEAETQAIKDIARKKLNLVKYQAFGSEASTTKSPEQIAQARRDQPKLIEYLVKQGFSYSQVKTALSELEID